MRKVFFSFHYDDAWRVSQIRNMWVAHGKESVRFEDAAAYEKVKRQGGGAIKNWIDQQMHGTSVTVVLIGTDTHKRPFVNYEIEKSIQRRNGLLGIHINQLKGQDGRTKTLGKNPLENHVVSEKLFGNYESAMVASDFYETYDGSELFGFSTPYENIASNIGDWIEEAARQVGR